MRSAVALGWFIVLAGVSAGCGGDASDVASVIFDEIADGGSLHVTYRYNDGTGSFAVGETVDLSGNASVVNALRNAQIKQARYNPIAVREGYILMKGAGEEYDAEFIFPERLAFSQKPDRKLTLHIDFRDAELHNKIQEAVVGSMGNEGLVVSRDAVVLATFLGPEAYPVWRNEAE